MCTGSDLKNKVKEKEDEIVMLKDGLGSRYDLQMHLRSSLSETNHKQLKLPQNQESHISDSCGTSKHLGRF